MPKVAIDMLMLGDGLLDQESRSYLFQLIGNPLEDGSAKWFTGQNLVWRGRIALLQACLTQNAALLKEAKNQILSEVSLTDEEGIQIDASFHQHGNQLYSHGYGAIFSSDMSQLIWLLSGSPFAVPDDKISLIEKHMLDGQQWMMRGQTRCPLTMGRNIAREGETRALRSDHRDYSAFLETIICAQTERQKEFVRWRERLQSGNDTLVGHKHFWRSDYTVHHTSSAMVSLKCASTRTVRNETGNKENLQGRFWQMAVCSLFKPAKSTLTYFHFGAGTDCQVPPLLLHLSGRKYGRRAGAKLILSVE